MSHPPLAQQYLFIFLFHYKGHIDLDVFFNGAWGCLMTWPQYWPKYLDKCLASPSQVFIYLNKLAHNQDTKGLGPCESDFIFASFRVCQEVSESSRNSQTSTVTGIVWRLYPKRYVLFHTWRLLSEWPTIFGSAVTRHGTWTIVCATLIQEDQIQQSCWSY